MSGGDCGHEDDRARHHRLFAEIWELLEHPETDVDGLPEKVAQKLCALRERVQDLERSRDAMQAQRDDAIQQRDLADQAANNLLRAHPAALEIEALKVEPGTVLILRVTPPEDPAELAAERENYGAIARGLNRQGVTLLVARPDVPLDLEKVSEAVMRHKGWLRAERIEPGPRILEAACGAYRAMLDKARAHLPEELVVKVDRLLDQPIPVLPVESAKEGGPA